MWRDKTETETETETEAEGAYMRVVSLRRKSKSVANVVGG